MSDFGKENFTALRSIYEDFDIKEAEKVKETEKVTNHDVKAVEYYLKEKFFQFRLGKMVRIHSFWAYITGYKQHCNSIIT